MVLAVEGENTFASAKLEAPDKERGRRLCSCHTFATPVLLAVQQHAAGDCIAVSEEAPECACRAGRCIERRVIDAAVIGVFITHHASGRRNGQDLPPISFAGGEPRA